MVTIVTVMALSHVSHGSVREINRFSAGEAETSTDPPRTEQLSNGPEPHTHTHALHTHTPGGGCMFHMNREEEKAMEWQQELHQYKVASLAYLSDQSVGGV